MPRYIDADALYEKLYPLDLVDKKLYTINAKAVADAIANTPTADVVPKSEVSILTVQNMALENTKSELQHELNKYKGVENIFKDNMGELIMATIVQAKQELASEIFAEIEKLHLHITNDFDLRRYAELKKKYTE